MHRRALILLALVLAGLLGTGAAEAEQPSQQPADPPYSVPEPMLADAVDCWAPDGGVTGEPVVLVHGTFTEGHEEYAWNYELRLRDEGLAYCVVTYPDRGMADQQISAEYVAYAVQTAAALSPTGKVDLVGHSQGASMPRWAIKYWPSVRAALDDVVLHAGPHHGTRVANADALGVNPALLLGGMPAGFWQFDPDSNFVRLLNEGDETPGDIDYTSIYAETDELVQPSGLEPGVTPTAVLSDRPGDPSQVVNIDIQAPDVCPGRLVDHLSLGTTDRFVMELTIATLVNDGPAHLTPELLANCSLPDQYLTPAQFGAFGRTGDGPSLADLAAMQENQTTEEPPTRPYAAD